MRRLAVFMISIVVVLLAGAIPAWAHVTLSPTEAPKGSDAVLTFSVPNEEQSATTTKLVVDFPQDHPIADALVQPIPGWSFKVETTTVSTPIHTDSGDVTDAVKTVTWTTTGSGIPAGGFQQFSVSVGLPSDGDSLQFDAHQTYSDGKTVDWAQQTLPGVPAPDSPAPVLKLTAGADSSASASATATKSTGSDDSAKTIAIIALIVGIVGLLVGIGAFVMGRRTT